MRVVWDLPEEVQFRNTGEDWLQNLLDPCCMEIRIKILLLLWRCWFLRDDYIHNSGKELVGRSVDFLTQYEVELNSSNSVAVEVIGGKQVQQHEVLSPPESASHAISKVSTSVQGGDPKTTSTIRWRPPVAGTVKVNADASILADSGQCHVGAVARDNKGQVFFMMSKRGESCSAVEEAEAQAMLSGLHVLSTLYKGAIIVEIDCSFLAKELQPRAGNLSACFPMINDIVWNSGNFNQFKSVMSGGNKTLWPTA